MHKLVTNLLDSKYKHIIGYTVAIIGCGLVAWYSCASIKDNYWAKVAANKSAQVEVLQKKVAAADVAIAKIDGELVAAKVETSTYKAKATKIQKKVDDLISTYETPEAPGAFIATQAVMLEECNTKVETMKTDIGTFIEEIKIDRTLIEAVTKENTLLETKDAKLTEEVVVLKEVAGKQTDIIGAKDKQLDAEKTKTKIWKRIAIGAGSVALALLLL